MPPSRGRLPPRPLGPPPADESRLAFQWSAVPEQVDVSRVDAGERAELRSLTLSELQQRAFAQRYDPDEIAAASLDSPDPQRAMVSLLLEPPTRHDAEEERRKRQRAARSPRRAAMAAIPPRPAGEARMAAMVTATAGVAEPSRTTRSAAAALEPSLRML